MISRCSSPIPEMMVCPISSSVVARKVGSSLARAARAMESRSWPSLVLGSIATETTGSGNSIASSTIGLFSTHSVSPVLAFRSPTAAAMSPAATRLTSSRLLACIRRRRPTRSLVPRVEL